MSSINVTMTPEEFEQWRDSAKLLAQANEQVERERRNYKSSVDRLTRYESSLADAILAKKESERLLSKEKELRQDAEESSHALAIECVDLRSLLSSARRLKWYQFVGVRNV